MKKTAVLHLHYYNPDFDERDVVEIPVLYDTDILPWRDSDKEKIFSRVCDYFRSVYREKYEDVYVSYIDYNDPTLILDRVFFGIVYNTDRDNLPLVFNPFYAVDISVHADPSYYFNSFALYHDGETVYSLGDF